jgi:hypothetical protein
MTETAILNPVSYRLRKELHGEVLFDRFSCGRYSTDASLYQIEPVGVVVQDRRRRAGGHQHCPRGGGAAAARGLARSMHEA